MSSATATASSGLGSASYRGLSLDVGRKAFTADAVVRLIDRLSELGFTALHLHLTETHRVGVRLPGFEELAAEDAWDADDATRIVEAAERAGIALVPEIDLPSHAAALLVGREHLQLVDRHGVVHEDRLDISQPEALTFALGLLEAASALFPGDAIHLGGDEFFGAPWEDDDARDPERFPALVEHARTEIGPDATAMDSFALFIECSRGLGARTGPSPDALERPRRPGSRRAAGADQDRRGARRVDPLAGVDAVGAGLP